MLIVQTPGSWNRAGILEINLNRHQKQSLGKSTKKFKQGNDGVFSK